MYLVILLGHLWTKSNWHALADVVGHGSSWVNHDLSKIGDASNGSIFNLMKFVPKILLDLVHVAPQIHSIGFNVGYFLLIRSLFILIAINILRKVGVFWSLDDDRSHFLWSLNLFYLLLEPLLDYLWYRHIVNFRGSLDLSSCDQSLIWCHSAMGSACCSRLTLFLIILLNVEGVHFLAELLTTAALVSLQQSIVLQLRLRLWLFLLCNSLWTRQLWQCNLRSLQGG